MSIQKRTPRVHGPKHTPASFWSFVKISDGITCWNWTYRKNPKGYGMISFGGRNTLAHRLAYTFTFGPIPKGLQIRHSCHNPSCCNPSHLSTGTNMDNVMDKIHAGRQLVGEKTRSAKLTATTVLEIRELYKTGKYTHRDLANLYNVTHQSIEGLLNGKTWKHI